MDKVHNNNGAQKVVQNVGVKDTGVNDVTEVRINYEENLVEEQIQPVEDVNAKSDNVGSDQAIGII